MRPLRQSKLCHYIQKGANSMTEIEVLIRARYPIIYVVTYEEERVEQLLLSIAKDMGKDVFSWSVTRGLITAGLSLQSRKTLIDGSADPLIALDGIMQRVEPAVYLMKDFHQYIAEPSITRKMREIAMHLKNSYKTLILISPRVQIPVELEKDITVVDFDLPDYPTLVRFFDDILKDIGSKPEIKIDLDSTAKERFVKAFQGLTFKEAENVIARALIIHLKLDAEVIPTVLSEKKQIIRKSGILEYYEYNEGLENIGGLKNLKEWFMKRSSAFSDEARNFGLPAPKGVMLLGIQGCGKSLCAKTVSSLWKQPLLHLDMSRIFSSLIGSSEENLRRAMKIAESVAPAILWVDEIEKAFAGTQSSSFSDAGTTSRVFGGFITWLQEKTSPVFVIATANAISQLPPELMRKGRFDEIFFVDLPSKEERKEIFAIHLKKRGRPAKEFDLELLSARTEGFSGAEIEEAIVSALYDVFYLKKDLKTEHILKSVSETVPISKTMAEQIEEMREWAKGRARKTSE